VLERSLESVGGGVHVVDIVGEPGIGKTRLLHEFHAHATQRRARILGGLCTPDGQQTPFRIFIDIVRTDFRIALGDKTETVESKLDESLRGLGLSSEQNLGLLLNLLGREAPRGALSGLDGVLTGLRTRDLLVQVVRARSRLAPLILVLEDIQWLDSASEALLGNLIAIDDPLPLLILHTRRPAYVPPWAGSGRVARLALDPLSARETSRLAQARLGVDDLPPALSALIAAKAEGNALFAEEILSFLLERGVITRSARGVAFDSSAVTATLHAG
jgi:predicted ATPase